MMRWNGAIAEVTLSFNMPNRMLTQFKGKDLSTYHFMLGSCY
jgi:hypothetical protein